jgi:hypothetical protein
MKLKRHNYEDNHEVGTTEAARLTGHPPINFYAWTETAKVRLPFTWGTRGTRSIKLFKIVDLKAYTPPPVGCPRGFKRPPKQRATQPDALV